MRYGSLFTGIGGFDLGFDRAGMECAWQVEIDSFCLRVLQKHWPNVPKYKDVHNVGKHNLQPVDVIAGGFPCQDISESNINGSGLDGEQSGLWWEFHRIISELRPRFAVVENVANLFSRGVDRIIGSLAEIGYDAEWEIIPACAFGAPHSRERVFIVAYPQQAERRAICSQRCGMDDPNISIFSRREKGASWPAFGSPKVDRGNWAREPGMGRVANGVPNRMDRLGALGNAVVPQVAEWIGRRIVEVEQVVR